VGKLIINGEDFDVADGEKILETIENAGVPIGCSNGVCGTCEVEILEGMDCLSEHNQEELDLGMEGNRRLGCQLRMKGGCVKLTY